MSSGSTGHAIEALLGTVFALFIGPDGTIWIRSQFLYSVDPSGSIAPYTGTHFPSFEGPEGEFYYFEFLCQGSSPPVSRLFRMSDRTLMFEGYRGVGLGLTSDGGLLVL